MDGFALDEVTVLILADFVLDLIDGELGLEGKEVVEHLDAAAREVVEQVGVGAVFLVEGIGEHEEFLVGIEEGLLHALEAHLAAAEILVDAEANEGSFEDILIEAVVAERIDEFDEVSELAGIDDAEAVDIPADGVAGFGDPPVVVVAETNDAPVES